MTISSFFSFLPRFRGLLLGPTAVAALTVVANGQTWTQTPAVSNKWLSVGMSADGFTLTAVGLSPGQGCTSTDGGITWSTNGFTYNGRSLASSADGKTLVVVGASGGLSGDGIQISTNTGATWNRVTNLFWGTRYRDSREFNWRSVACSADARIMVVECITAGGPGQTFVSTNSGDTWTEAIVPGGWALASSADGSLLASGAGTEAFYCSTNSGLQWVKKSAPAGFWWSMASSADGSKLAAAVGTNANGDLGSIYTSPDGGNTWELSGAPPAYWMSVASSADGSNLAAAAYQGGLFTSSDGGTTWVSNNVPSAGWVSIASSADGVKLCAVAFQGGIWTARSSPTPLLEVANQDGKLALSWTVPSTPFILQRNPGLSPQNWEDTPGTPVLNLSNLRNEISLPFSWTNAFYRLMSR